ncbi:MAG: lipoprotein-releasing ABC transporter permease subunit [Burkholderiaceae bacterium]
MKFFRNMPFEWLVGLRYTRAGKRSSRNSFISFISLISVSGIALGVAALITVLSIMNGFQKEVRDRMLSVLSHIEVFDASGQLQDWRATAQEAFRHEEVIGAAPYVLAQAMVTRNDTVRGIIIRGVLPQEEARVSDVAGQMTDGKFSDLEPGALRVLIGSALAKTLAVKVGDRINLLVPQGDVGAGTALPQLTQLTVAGIFNAGHYEYDSTLAFIHMEDAMHLFKLGAPSGLRLKVRDMQQAPQVALDLSRSLSGDLLIRDWSRQNRTWFAAVQSQKNIMFLILALIIAVAAFNLVSTLVMTVTDKQSDIAILRTLGASPGAISRIFMIQGALIGFLGTAAGVALGVLLAENIGAIAASVESLFGLKFLSSDVYLINTLPSELRWRDVYLIGAMAFALSLAATLYPSWWAARVKPAEALRYE